MEGYEPTIIAFVCNWCTYTAADLAGTSRLIQPANVRMIRMMCTGMVDPKYVIKALRKGRTRCSSAAVIRETVTTSTAISRPGGASSS